MDFKEEDEINLKYSKSFIYDALKEVTQKYQEYVRDHQETDKHEDLNTMVDRIKSLFEHQDKVEAYTKHINILLKIYDFYKNNSMKELMTIEQELDISS